MTTETEQALRDALAMATGYMEGLIDGTRVPDVVKDELRKIAAQGRKALGMEPRER